MVNFSYHTKVEAFRKKYVNHLFTALCAALFALVLAGCTLQSAGTSTDEHAAENRQYMAQLNQKATELEEVLDQFQAAVSAQDAVAMKASADAASKLVQGIKESKAPESLAGVKDMYVGGFEAMDAVMNDYVALYTDLAAGNLDQASFDRRWKSVQTAYEGAVKKLTAADEELTKLANE